MEQTHQWKYASDVGDRANATYGTHPEKWDFTAHKPADLVVINLGTNDHRDPNNLPGETFAASYVDLIETVHETWPAADVVLMVCMPVSSMMESRGESSSRS